MDSTDLPPEEVDLLLKQLDAHNVGDVAEVELRAIVEAIEGARVPRTFLPARLVRLLLLERRAAAELLAGLEDRLEMSCIEPAPDCQCAGCITARQRHQQ